MDGLHAGALIPAAAHRLAVECDEIGSIRAQAHGPGHEASLKQHRIDAVEHHAKPVFLGRPKKILRIALQERLMPFAPGRDLVIVVASRDRGAGDEKQDLRQRILDLAALARITHRSKVVEHQTKAILHKTLIHETAPLAVLLNQNQTKPATQPSRPLT